MLSDLYFRSKDDPNYVEGVLETSNEIECLLNQIFMIIKTNSGEVLAGPYFGGNVDETLFSTAGSIHEFKQKIVEQINTYSLISQKYNIDVLPNTYDDGYQQTAVLDISVEGHNLLGFMINNEGEDY